MHGKKGREGMAGLFLSLLPVPYIWYSSAMIFLINKKISRYNFQEKKSIR